MDRETKSANVILIGGGPSGVAAFAELLRGRYSPKSIALIDPGTPGIGNVYGDLNASDPNLMCNSTVAGTFYDLDDRHSYADFLTERGYPVSLADHFPRLMVGEQCRDRYLKLCDRAASMGVRFKHISARADNVQKLDDGTYRVNLDDGAIIDGDHVLLCTGLDSPSVGRPFDQFIGHPRLVVGAYPVKRLRELPADRKILVLGLRSSAQDAMVVLTKSNHRIVMTSPSGSISAVRDTLRIPDTPNLDEDALLALDPDDPEVEAKTRAVFTRALNAVGGELSLLEQISTVEETIPRLRDELRLAKEGKTRWCDLNFEIINGLNKLIAPWDSATRAAVMPRVTSYLTRYVNSLPIFYAQRLLDGIDKGLVEVSATWVKDVKAHDDGWTITWQDGRIEEFGYVVATSGYHFPRFPMMGGDAIRISNYGGVGSDPLSDIGIDLRIRFKPDGKAENIWAIGAATNQRYPLAHISWHAAINAKSAAADISTLLERESASV